MGCSTSGPSVLCCLPEFAQSHVYWVGNVIQPSHPLSPPFSFCFQSFPESFPMNQLFTAGGQSIRASALGLPMNIQSWFPLGLTALISLLSKGLSRVFSSIIVWKHQYIWANHARGGKNLLKHHNTSLDNGLLFAVMSECQGKLPSSSQPKIIQYLSMECLLFSGHWWGITHSSRCTNFGPVLNGWLLKSIFGWKPR